jgi:hypothetical protein
MRLLALGLIIALALVFAAIWRIHQEHVKLSWLQAETDARWRPYSWASGSGNILVGVERVAQRKGQTRVLLSEQLVAVPATEGGDALLEARALADMRACLYNSLY